MSAQITTARLAAFAGSARPSTAVVAAALEAARLKLEIAKPREVRFWMANMHHETGGFVKVLESLAYSAAGAAGTWPKHFASPAAAQPYATAGVAGVLPRTEIVRRQTELARIVYGGRNGNDEAEDGYNFRGRGYLEITGRANYRAAGQRLGQPYEAHPEMLEEPEHAALTAADFWVHSGCNAALEAHSADAEACRASRQIVNGGLIGILDVMALVKRAAALWAD